MSGSEHPDVFDADWDDVRGVLSDLENDGYEVKKFGGSSSEPTPEKDYYLVVSRETNDLASTGSDQ